MSEGKTKKETVLNTLFECREENLYALTEKDKERIATLTKDNDSYEKLFTIIENCPQNHKCPAVNVCPVGALIQKDFEAPKIDYDKCVKCGKCSNFCPKKALVLE